MNLQHVRVKFFVDGDLNVDLQDIINTFHGWVALMPLGFEGPEIETGYRLPKTSWGRGIATEATTRILAYGFEALELGEIVAVVDPGNTRSLRIMEKLGFIQSGERDIYEKTLQYFRLGKAEWLSAQAKT